MPSPSPKLKYRPSLSGEAINYLVDLLQSVEQCPEQEECIRALGLFQAKVNLGISGPSHVAIGRQPIESKLGFEEDKSIEILLEMYANTPNLLSKAQLKKVQFHRYANDLMSKEEEVAYEQQEFGGMDQIKPAAKGG